MPTLRAEGSQDELTASRFSIELDGLLVATFTECSGLSGEIEVETYQEGGLNGFAHSLPGRATFGNITLTSGFINAINMWTWFYDATLGNIVRKNVSIIMHTQMYEEAMRWNLEAAYPVRWEGPSFTATGTDAIVHSIELAHHGLALTSASTSRPRESAGAQKLPLGFAVKSEARGTWTKQLGEDMPTLRAEGSQDELTASRFSIELDGLLVATFTECSGLSGEIEVETYQEGGLNGFAHSLPGRATFGNITLTSGFINAINMWTWFYDATLGNIVRKNVSIIMHTQMYEEAMRWNLEAAYPVRWEGPSFTATGTDAIVHSIELAHHGLALGS